ncbi:shieldin complex subunit 2 isoform 2-T2 [Polymixia lowei]
MTDKPKIHVFMGAPPPSDLVLVPEVGIEDEEQPPAQWSTVELSWVRGRLRPRAGEDVDHCGYDRYHHRGNQARSPSEEEGTCQADQSDADKDDVCSKADQPIEGLPGHDDQSNADKEDPCSESIHEYLDSCFPVAGPDPDPEPSPGRSSSKSAAGGPSVSVQTQYLSTWTVSQALVLRGRCGTQPGASPVKTPPRHSPTPALQTPPRHSPTPALQTPPRHSPTPALQTPPRHSPTPPLVSSSTPELYSPATTIQSPRDPATQPGSMELFYEPMLSQRLEEGGVILEATRDGVLCSQAGKRPELGASGPGESRLTPLPRSPAKTPPSPSNSPDRKRPRVSPVFSRTEAVPPPPDRAGVSLHGPTTLLVKSGPSAGTTIPLASIIVTDQSGIEMKVVLWRRAAFWALTVYPGDVLLLTGVEVNHNKWRGETVLQSTYTSRLLNLGQLTTTTSPPVPQNVNGRTLSSLCEFLRDRRPLLVSLPPRTPQTLTGLPYAHLRTLRAHTLVHALLLVTHTDMITAWRSEVEGRSRSGAVLKAVLTVEQADGHQGAVVLWGAALAWLPCLNSNTAAVWDFRVLLVREGLTSDLPELHSTPWSSAHPLPPDDRRAAEFYRTRQNRTASIPSLELDLHTLLSQKYTGDVELRVHITAFQFQGGASQNAPLPPLGSSTPLVQILEMLSGDVTYTGCGRCASELDTDANGIYCPCYPCLPHTAVRRYYRPVVLTVKEADSQVCVQVSPVLTQRILLDTPPDRLNKATAPGSEVKHVHLVAERIQSLLSLPRKTFLLIVRSHFLCDENSVPTAQDFQLLDLQFPGE